MSDSLRLLTVEHILHLHVASIEQYGGEPGVRDFSLLESAVYAAQFFIQYEEGWEQTSHGICQVAAHYWFHLSSNHPFVDGNKRVSFVAALLFLWINGFECAISYESAVDVSLRLASGHCSKEELAQVLFDGLVSQ